MKPDLFQRRVRIAHLHGQLGDGRGTFKTIAAALNLPYHTVTNDAKLMGLRVRRGGR